MSDQPPKDKRVRHKEPRNKDLTEEERRKIQSQRDARRHQTQQELEDTRRELMAEAERSAKEAINELERKIHVAQTRTSRIRELMAKRMAQGLTASAHSPPELKASGYGDFGKPRSMKPPQMKSHVPVPTKPMETKSIFTPEKQPPKSKRVSKPANKGIIVMPSKPAPPPVKPTPKVPPPVTPKPKRVSKPANKGIIVMPSKPAPPPVKPTPKVPPPVAPKPKKPVKVPPKVAPKPKKPVNKPKKEPKKTKKPRLLTMEQKLALQTAVRIQKKKTTY
jgi:hypothetical protein